MGKHPRCHLMPPSRNSSPNQRMPTILTSYTTIYYCYYCLFYNCVKVESYSMSFFAWLFFFIPHCEIHPCWWILQSFVYISLLNLILFHEYTKIHRHLDWWTFALFWVWAVANGAAKFCRNENRHFDGAMMNMPTQVLWYA